MLGSSGSSHYYEVGSERTALESMVTTQYSPYASESSAAFTKLFDAVGLAESATSSDTSLAALPSLAVIFTDGADTASTRYSSAASARAQITTAKPTMKVYAIGLGNENDESALRTLSQERFYSAASDSLVDVFQEVASELGAIYRYRVLVPSAAQQAAGKLTVNFAARPPSRSSRWARSARPLRPPAERTAVGTPTTTNATSRISAPRAPTAPTAAEIGRDQGSCASPTRGE